MGKIFLGDNRLGGFQAILSFWGKKRIKNIIETLIGVRGEGYVLIELFQSLFCLRLAFNFRVNVSR